MHFIKKRNQDQFYYTFKTFFQNDTTDQPKSSTPERFVNTFFEYSHTQMQTFLYYILYEITLFCKEK